MPSAAQPALDFAPTPDRELDRRVFISAFGYESSYELYCSLARKFRISFNDYLAIVLARFHGLKDPSWTNVGRIDVPNVRGVQLLLEDAGHPADIHHMRARVDPEHREFYNERAREAHTSQAKYLGYVMAYIHGEPSIVDLGLTHGDRILQFAPTLREVEPGVYEARAS